MKMSAGPERNSTLDHEAAIREVRSWLNKGDVSRIRASAKDDENTPQEEIDLLNARLERDVQVRPGQDRRYPVNERWRALTQAYSYWRENDYI